MHRTAIILAPDDKGSHEIFGAPAVRRLVLAATRLGFDNIHLVGEVAALAPLLSGLLPRQCLHPLKADEPFNRVTGEISLPDEGKVLVMRAHHVIDKSALSRFLESCDGPAIQHLPAEGGSTAGDGFYLAEPCDLMPVMDAVWSGKTLHSDVSQRVVVVPNTNGLPYAVENKAIDGKVAEERLVNSLFAQTAADDGFIARHFDRHISRAMSKRLAHKNVTPNQITLTGMSIGLMGAYLLSLPGYWSKLVGSFLFVFCVIVDGVDGEVARLKAKESNFGHYLDITTDNIVHAAIFAGIAFGLFRDTGNAAYIQALWFLMGGFVLCLIAVWRCILRLTPKELDRSPIAVRAMALMSNRDFAYLVFALALVGRLQWFLIGAAAGSYVFAIALWAISRHERRHRAAVTKGTPAS